MKKYNFVIFDWDGCLAKTPHLLLKAFKTVLIKDGLFFKDEQIVKYMFGNWVEGLKYWGVQNPEGVIDRIKKQLEVDKLELELYPGARETLARLRKKGIILTLLTTGSSLEVLPYLTKTGITNYFKKVLTGDKFNLRKPDMRILEAAVGELGSKKSDTLWVGNSMNDLEMGKAAGIDTVIYYPQENEKFGESRVLNSVVGARVIRQLKELPGLL